MYHGTLAECQQRFYYFYLLVVIVGFARLVGATPIIRSLSWAGWARWIRYVRFCGEPGEMEADENAMGFDILVRQKPPFICIEAFNPDILRLPARLPFRKQDIKIGETTHFSRSTCGMMEGNVMGLPFWKGKNHHSYISKRVLRMS